MTAPTARRLAWGSFALSVALGLSGIAIALVGVPASQASIASIALALAIGVFGTVGALIASRKPENAIGWLFCAVTLIYSLSAPFGGAAERALATGETGSTLARVSDWIGTWSWIPAVLIPITLLFLLFPTGRPLSPRWRALPWAAVLGTIAFTLSSAFSPHRYTAGDALFLKRNPFALAAFDTTAAAVLEAAAVIALVGALVGGIASLMIRLRRSTGDERQQLRLLTSTAAIVVAVIVASGVVSAAAPDNDVVVNVAIAVILIGLTAIPVAVGVAILKYRLYDIDVVINKTLVFGTLAAFITLAYVAIVVGIGSAIGRGNGSNVGLSIAATAVVALAFHPVQRRVQRFANRLVYGKRATPYEVMTDFAHRVAGTLSIGDVLPQMAEAAARGVGASWSRVRLFLPVGEERIVHWPADEPPPNESFERAIAVFHQGEPVGEIAVAKRPGEPITPAEDRLLSDLASQAGIPLRNVRLTVELQERLREIAEHSEQLRISRQRLVTARDAQRRQLERDIREGAQGQLLEIAEKLRVATLMITTHPEASVLILDELGEEANVTLDGLRDLARGIFPPLLAEEGVYAALEAHIRKVGMRASIDTAPELDGVRYDPDTEAAVYFCCVQALQNVVRHAGDTIAVVRIACDDGLLEFQVRDEGAGFDAATTPKGMGLQIMTDRMEALGGSLLVESSPGRGTTVTGRVPARSEAVVG